MPQIPSDCMRRVQKRALAYSALLVVLGSVILAGVGQRYQMWYLVVPWTAAFVAASVSWFVPLSVRERKVEDISDVALIDEEVDLEAYPKKELVWQMARSRPARWHAVQTAILSAFAVNLLVFVCAPLLYSHVRSPNVTWESSLAITIVVATPLVAVCRIHQASWVLRKWNDELADQNHGSIGSPANVN
jgi:hypothetical protein